MSVFSWYWAVEAAGRKKGERRNGNHSFLGVSISYQASKTDYIQDAIVA